MNEDSTKNYYTTRADEYFEATHIADLHFLWNELSERLESGDYILDLGCGSGRDMRHFAKRGFRVVGIDYSPGLVRMAEAFSGQTVILGDFASLPFEGDTFDAVWSIGSLLHLPRSSISSVLSEVRRVLKEDGVLLTSVKKGLGDEVDVLGRHNTFYSVEEWASVLSGSEYEVIDVKEMVEVRRNESGDEMETMWIVSLAKKVRGQRSLSSIEGTVNTGKWKWGRL